MTTEKEITKEETNGKSNDKSNDEPSNKQQVNFDIDRDTLEKIDTRWRADPQVPSRAEYIRRALFHYAECNPGVDTSDLTKSPRDDLSIELIDKIEETIKGSNNDLENQLKIIQNQLTSLLNQAKDTKTSDEERELEYYLDEITRTLFVEKLDTTLAVVSVGQLVKLLKFDHHARFLPMWLEQQKDRGLLVMTRDNRFLWKHEMITRLYS